jgi:hypothetical protein
MRTLATFAALAALAAPASAATITGQYIEARTCDVYTGPCFANAEMDLGGKEALLAWKVDRGQWNGVSLDGLGVALVAAADNTIGDDGVFAMRARQVRAVIVVDERADARQRDALVAFVKDSAKKELTQNIVKVETAPFALENDYVDGVGKFQAGSLARIETRGLKKGDCVCTNETVYYQPLADVKDFSPAYSQTLSFQGDGLNNRWTTNGIRSAFLATFRR